MTCFFCNGTLEKGTTTHVSDIGERAMIVRGVPCFKCDQCSEISYTGNVYEELEGILDNLRDSTMEVAIINYPNKAA
ncbi:MAG: YgiT-type zinc finger protein [Defluviitaleaceae bacterium]|nr:YgiT-type zinc finger protein [Defluviitaleaceae bacterium]